MRQFFIVFLIMIEIIFQNEDFLACVKPVGVPSQCDGADDMVKLLTASVGSEVYPVHRLDTAVGGVMIFARNRHSAAYLSKEIAEKRFQKRYLAVVEGVPKPKIGKMEDLLFKDSQKNKSFVVKRERRGVKKASLDYRTIAQCGGKSLVSVLLQTGRSHQIRVQFSSRKMPLCGDGKYGSRDNGCTIALWSEEISFSMNKKDYRFRSKPDFASYPWNVFPKEAVDLCRELSTDFF